MIWSSIGVKNGDIREMSFMADPNYSLFIDQAIWIIIQVGKVHLLSNFNIFLGKTVDIFEEKQHIIIQKAFEERGFSLST